MALQLISPNRFSSLINDNQMRDPDTAGSSSSSTQPGSVLIFTHKSASVNEL